MDPASDRELTQFADPAGALDRAIELNKVKTGDVPKEPLDFDEMAEISDSPGSNPTPPKPIAYQQIGGKNLITLADCKGQLASDFSSWKKWRCLIIVWFVQISMNLNTSLYSNAIPGMAKDFDRSQDATRWGATVFLIAYAFGCELWAPWSGLAFPSIPRNEKSS